MDFEQIINILFSVIDIRVFKKKRENKKYIVLIYRVRIWL